MASDKITFDGGYGRVGLTQVAKGVCNGCGKQGPALHVDASDGEYACGITCLSCVTDLFSKYAAVSAANNHE